MNCSRCGSMNDPKSKFCIQCGNPLESVVEDTVVSNTVVQTPQPVQPSSVKSGSSVDFKNIGNIIVANIMCMVSALLRPFKTYKEKESDFSDIKKSAIFAGLVAVVMMLIGLITNMISSIFVKSYDFSTFSMKTSIDFGGLANVDYVSLIFKDLLIYAGVIAGVALFFYIASLVVKKTVDYSKMLYGVAIAVIPYAVGSMFLSPILGKIWSPLSIVAVVASMVYAISILVTFVNENIKFENKDHVIYFNLTCFTVLLTAVYYIVVKVITGIVTSGLGGLLGNL